VENGGSCADAIELVYAESGCNTCDLRHTFRLSGDIDARGERKRGWREEREKIEVGKED